MARIPMADKAGLLPYRDANARQQGAPGMDWKVAEALAPGRAADDALGGVKGGANALAGFLRERQGTEDRLAQAQLRNLHDKVYGELDAFIRDTPGATDEDVAGRRQDAQERFEEGADEIYGRMSGEARALAREQVVSWTMDGDRRRDGVRRQAYVTGALARSRAEEEAMLANGNFDGYREYVRSQTGLYTGTAIQAKLDELPRLEQEWRVRRSLDEPGTDLKALVRELGEKDGDGHWLNFTDMSPEYRGRMLREAVSRLEAMTEAEDDAFLASLADDSPMYTADRLRDMHANGELADGRFARLMKWREAYDSRKEAEERAAWESADDAVREWAAEGKAASKSLSDEERRRRQDEWEAFLVDVETAETPEDLPATLDMLDGQLEDGRLDKDEYLRRRKAVKAALEGFDKERRREAAEREKGAATAIKAEATMGFAFSTVPSENRRQLQHFTNKAKDLLTDPDLLRSTLDWLQETAEAGLKGRGAFGTPDGKAVYSYLTDAFIDEDGTFRGLKWDPWGPRKDKSQEFMQARYYEIVELAAQMLEAGKGRNDVIEFIEGQVDELNEGRIMSILDGEARRFYTRPEHTGPGLFEGIRGKLAPGEVREVNGLKFRRRQDGTWIPVAGDGQ